MDLKIIREDERKENKMKVDRIIKNAKIFTADKDNPLATALAVKEGKFVYVGDEAGLSEYEGEVTDLGGKFIMPGIIDSHVHITTGVAFVYADLGEFVVCNNKQEALAFMADYIAKHPGMEPYRFMLQRALLNGEELIKALAGCKFFFVSDRGHVSHIVTENVHAPLLIDHSRISCI